MRRKEYKVVKHGVVDLARMSKMEQKAFYITIMERILELYEKENK